MFGPSAVVVTCSKTPSPLHFSRKVVREQVIGPSAVVPLGLRVPCPKASTPLHFYEEGAAPVWGGESVVAPG